MSEYCAYIVGDDGHFVNYDGFACRDDSEAISKSKQSLMVTMWNFGAANTSLCDYRQTAKNSICREPD
jgi:hypothetical protein